MNILIILITAILANAVPIIRDLPPEPNIPPNGDFNLSEDVLHRTSNPSEIHQRFYRASDPILDRHVFNLKMVARITNGIYLIQGITSGTIDSDELISELLRFGPVKPSDISAIDISKVKDAVNDMKSLPEQLVATAEAEKVEKVFDGLKEILNEVDGIGNLAEWTDEKEHFKNEIGRLAKDGLSITDVSDINSGCSDWKTNYQKLSGNTPSIDHIKEAVRVLGKIKKASVNLNTFPIFWKFSNFSSAADGISPILKAEIGVPLFQSLSKSLAMTESDGNIYKTFAKSIPGKVDPLIAHLGAIPVVSKLLASRSASKRQLHHTLGLPNGVLDLSLITDAIVDPWITKVVKTKILKTALTRLEGLAEVSKTVDKSLEKDLDVDSLSNLLVSMSDVSKKIVAIKSGIPQGYKCVRPSPDDVNPKQFTDLKDAVKKIDAKLRELSKNRDELFEYLKSSQIIEMCDDLLAICKKAKDDGSNLQEVVTEIQGYENLDVMTTHTNQLETITNRIKPLKEIQTDAVTANGVISSLDEYQKDLKTYSDYFKCLQDQDQLPSVFEAIGGLKKIRGWKDDTTYSKTLTDGLNVVQKVVDVKSGLEKMKGSIKELSELKTSETDAMKDLPEAATHSDVIGKAVQGLAGMAEALEKEDDLKKIVDNIDVVESGKQKTTDPEDVESLNELVKLSKDITPMLNSLTIFSTSLSEFSKSDSLAVQSDIFSSAKQVSGVTGTFSRMSKAVGELKKISAPDAAELTKVEEGLKTMDTLDLNFAGFHKSFDDSKNSLTALDLFFAKTWKKFQPTTPIPAQRPTLGLETSTGDDVGSDAQSAAEKDEEKKEDNDDLKYAGGSVAFLLVTLAIVFFLLYKFQRPWLMKRLPCLCWKKEKKKEKQEDEKPSEPPLPPLPPLIGPILPPIGYFLKLFIVPMFKQFEVIRKEHNVEKENLIFCLYEFYEARHDACRLIAWVTRSNPPLLDHCRFWILKGKSLKKQLIFFSRFNYGRTIEDPVELENYGDRFQQTYLHGNYLMFDDFDFNQAKEDRTKWVLIEGPMPSSPEPDDPETPREKNSTIGKFWWLAKQNKTQSIVALLSPNEIKDYHYFPRKVNETFKEKDLTLKCDKLEIEFGGLLEIRTITGTFEKEPPFTLTHFIYTGWLNGSPPKVLTPLKKIFRKLATDSAPPIIHCTDGQERTGMFALAGLMKYRLKTRMGDLDITKCLIDVMKARQNALGDMSDVLFAGHLCMELLADGKKLPKSLQNDVDKLRSAWDRFNVENDRREPESVIQNFDKLRDSEKVHELRGKLEKKKNRKMEEAKQRKEEKK
ncbi:hypothetical protein CRE_08440 [Caenorhabditis remanei]|uniref:Tyrosine-protein phosphatase domain-containing protein n=1 Tax=Caenorhabditis remanei TaxID=31234 RepID=E3N011_CAERE|nr:hypothetical protein CRE_08440 [Caenorhabditis remanei]